MISVEALTKYYGSHPAIDQITFDVKKGEILGFLGPNGAGKTTTMRILTGYLLPTSGRAAVAGFDVVDESLDVKRRIGYLPENPPLYTEMTVWDYLTFVVAIKEVPKEKRNERIETAVDQCSLGDVQGRLIGHLSKGYRQRVGIAQALVHEPDVLILDEPTIGLDPKQIIEIRSLIKSLSGERTIILSTHILPEVVQTCERVVIINRGKIVAIDTFDELSASLKSAEQVKIMVARGNEELVSKIRKMNGVEMITSDKKDGGKLEIVVDLKRGVKADVREEISKVIVQGGYGLLEMAPLKLSLEEVFLQLTTEESEVSA